MAADEAEMMDIGGSRSLGLAAEGDDSDDSLGPLEVPWLVFTHARAASTVAVQLDCLRTCLDFPGTHKLRRRIERAIIAASPADPEAARGVATLPLSRLSVDGWSAKHSAAVRAGMRAFEQILSGSSSGGGLALVWEAYGSWLESLLRNPLIPAALAVKLRRRAVRVSSRCHAARAATPRVYLRWAVLRLVGPGGGKALVSAPALEQLAFMPAALNALLATAADAAAADEAAADAATTASEAYDAAVRILSIGLRRCPPRQMLGLWRGEAASAAEAGLLADTGAAEALAQAVGVVAISEAPGPLLAPLLPLIALRLQLSFARSEAQAKTDDLAALAPLAEAALADTAAAATAAATSTRAARRVASAAGAAGAGGGARGGGLATLLEVRPSDGSCAAAAVWSVWLRLAMGTAHASTSPKAILALLRRAVETLKQRAAHLHSLVATWIADEMSPEIVRRLAPSIVALPSTPLAVYETLLAAMAGGRGGGGEAWPMPPTVGAGGHKSSAERREIRELFEAAVSEHGATAVGVWLTYSDWHSRRAEFAEASSVHARALRSLAPELHAPFVEAALAATASA